MEHDFQPPLRAAEPGVAMTPLPDLDPAALEAARTAILQEADGAPIDEWISIAVRAYLAACSTVPEAGKAVDETAQDIIASTYIDGWNEPIGRLHALAILTHLEAAGYRVLASVPAPSGAEPVMWQVLLRKGWTDAGGQENAESWAKEGKQIRALYATPQAVPAEDVAIADLIERLKVTHDAWNNPPSDGLPDGASILIEVSAALTSLSTRLATAETARYVAATNYLDLVKYKERLEAEATSLRRKLEEAEARANRCESCGANDLEGCPRARDTPCWRDFHGGTRHARTLSGASE